MLLRDRAAERGWPVRLSARALSNKAWTTSGGGERNLTTPLALQTRQPPSSGRDVSAAVRLARAERRGRERKRLLLRLWPMRASDGNPLASRVTRSVSVASRRYHVRLAAFREHRGAPSSLLPRRRFRQSQSVAVLIIDCYGIG